MICWPPTCPVGGGAMTKYEMLSLVIAFATLLATIFSLFR